MKTVEEEAKSFAAAYGLTPQAADALYCLIYMRDREVERRATAARASGEPPLIYICSRHGGDESNIDPVRFGRCSVIGCGVTFTRLRVAAPKPTEVRRG